MHLMADLTNPEFTKKSLLEIYWPLYRAKNYPKIARRIGRNEYKEVMEWPRQKGLVYGGYAVYYT